MKANEVRKRLIEMDIQKFSGSGTTGVFPCYENQFKAGATKEDAAPIADMESFSVSFDNGVEEWYAYGQDGWANRLPTAKSVTISIKGKRNLGDTGNDFVADKAFKNGQNAMGYFEWVFPDGTKVSWEKAVYSITALNAADATNAGPLEFDVMSNGKPTITPPAV